MMIRTATPADAAPLARLIEEFNADYRPIRVTPEQVRARLLACRDTETTYVADVDGHLVAFACLRLVRHMSGDDFAAELTDLFVLPTHRRRGIATALVNEIVATARRAGSEDLIVITSLDDKSSQCFYNTLHFHRWALAMKLPLSAD